MDVLNTAWFDIHIMLVIVSLTLAAGTRLAVARSRALRRIRELTAAREALATHFSAVDRVADEPEFPLAALMMLLGFSEAINSRQDCEHFVEMMLSDEEDAQNKTREPDWFAAMDELRKLRPELLDEFDKAIMSGMVALFLRRASTASRFNEFMAKTASIRRETVIAQRIATLKATATNQNKHLSGGMMSAA